VTTPAHLLADLTMRGVRLSVVAGRLRVEAPAGVLTGADRLALAQHKPGLLALLADAPPAAWDQAQADALVAEVAARRRVFGEACPTEGAAARDRLADAIDAAWLARDLPGLRRAAAEYLALLPAWDAAEAGRLLAELRAEVGRTLAVEFGGRPPEALRNVLADALTIGEGYIDNHAAEAGRGWDALGLLRGLRNRVHQYAANAKRLATNPEAR
jgi:hypothetical protein